MFEIIVETTKGTSVDKLFCSSENCTIGKTDENLIVLQGWHIQDVHAQLTDRDDGVHISGLVKKPGIKVNGKKMDEFGPIGAKDVIEIHSYQIRIIDNRQKKLKAIKAAKASDKASEASDSKAESEAPKLDEQMTEAEIQQLAVMQHWKIAVRNRLIKQMDLRRVDVNEMSDEELAEVTSTIITEVIAGMDGLPKEVSKEELARQVLNESIGLGPLEDMVDVEEISEIMVNSHDEIYFEEAGKLKKSRVTFSDDKAVLAAIERIVAPLGRRIDESSPMVDARLKDGSRVNAVIRPLALKGPCITIRKFMKEKLTAQHLINFGSLNQTMVDFLRIAVEQKRNIIISGGTGSGKTTLLNMLSSFIPDDERIITVEDAAELKLQQPNLISLEARPPNQEGKGEVSIRDLVKNCLRMRPDRVVVGECRSGEALDMLQAMNTGHDGSLTTAHANTPRDCISRVEVMVMMAGMDLPVVAIREQISSAVDLIVQQTRFSDGSRKVISICEISGMEGDRVQLAEIFRFNQTGYDENGKVRGAFEPTGLVPEFYEDLYRRGVDVDMSIFSSASGEIEEIV